VNWQTRLEGDPVPWLLASNEPWTRYRTLVDLLDYPETDEEVVAARKEMVAHRQIRGLINDLATWGERPLKRHNDASHPIYSLSTLADFGLRYDDDGVPAGLETILAHQSPEGAFQTLLSIPVRYGGSGEDEWSWMACDAPTVLYSLLAMGLGGDQRVQRAVEQLAGLVDEAGWRCVVGEELGRMRGPGRRTDPCPIANVYALNALAQAPEWSDSQATRTGAEMLLWHWEHRAERKLYLFGIGSDFRKLKYPFVWYDVLHVLDVLSRFPFVRSDARFREMVEVVVAQGDSNGRFTASSIYRAWKDWSFADKKRPSPWLTFLCHRVMERSCEGPRGEDDGQ
jgi:hypothetical protein